MTLFSNVFFLFVKIKKKELLIFKQKTNKTNIRTLNFLFVFILADIDDGY